MRIAVLGAGGTGGFFGACLARGGHDVTFIARGKHLEAMRANGLRIESADPFTVRPVKATDDPRTVGPVDVVLVCVKSFDLDAAAQAIRPMVGAHTAVIPVLNGVDAAERIASAVGARPVLGGLAHILASIAEPGVIRHESPNLQHLTFGEFDGAPSGRVARLADALKSGGFPVRVSGSIRTDLWTKFVFMCGVSGVCAVTRLPFGPIRRTPSTRALVERAMTEVAALAEASNVALASDVVATEMARVDALAPGSTSSMARDLARGHRLEIEALNGSASRLGEALGVPVPVNDVLYACLKPYEVGTPAP